MGKVQRVSFDSVESSLGKAGSSVVSSFSKVGSSMKHGLDADGDGHLTAADLAGAAKASAKTCWAPRRRVDVQRRQGRRLLDQSGAGRGLVDQERPRARPRCRRRRELEQRRISPARWGQSAKSLVALPGAAGRAVMSAGGARARRRQRRWNAGESPARPTSAGEFFPRRSSLLQAPGAARKYGRRQDVGRAARFKGAKV